ncbi:MAG: Rne/Rng family ribonuclease, partial [Propionibacteriaceae bacterium]|nr:Rne/Rng family ribonuclease [Propionibacteriaceae bacterium]
DEAEDTPKRRRRRGGRRRRRSSRGDDEAGAEDEADSSAPDAEDAEAEDSDGEEAKTTTRRRRRRRRRGEDASGDDEPGTDVVVKVRDPRRSSADSDQVTGIEGSTRLEAKRQRRKESRAAGRRRAPILSEAEFLARRESVDRKLVIRQGEDYTQLAVLEDNVLVEHYVDRASATSLIGNIYLGKVQNVLPSMEAAFIDIGRGRNAVLYAGEIDWDGLGHTGERKVEEVFKSGQAVLVQVTKDPIGAKGARLTSHISLPGRYIVYSPGGHLSGISRKLPDVERTRLKEILSTLIGDDASVIVRTAAEGVSEEELVRDVNRLKAQWEIIEKKSKQGSAPQQLYAEPDLTLRIVRDLFTEDFNEMIIQGDGSAEDAFDAISAYVTHVAPHLVDRVRRYEPVQGSDCFTNFRIDEQIAKALERKVFLPSGGSLIIDRTEAMTVIDVNTGKFTGTGGNLEATVTSNNLEAAEEIVRQLRLRDIGGIIVIDFIDMVLPSNRELLLRRLVECLGRDRTRHQVAEVTSLGLVQLTRKKIGTGLAEAFTEQCESCGGRGYHRFEEPVDSQAPADGGERPSKRRRRGGGNG